MLVVETVARIRREHTDGKSIKGIARDLRLSRNIVRKAARAEDADFSYDRKEQPRLQTGPFSDRLTSSWPGMKNCPGASGRG